MLERPVAFRDHSICSDHGFERVVVDAAILPATTTRETALQALDLVEMANRPATPADLAQALAKLRMKTAHRAYGVRDEEALALTYIEELLAYPGDVALAALAERRQWWPTWAELEKSCGRLAATRNALRRALRDFLNSDQKPLSHLRSMPGSAGDFARARWRAGLTDPPKAQAPKFRTPLGPDRDQQTAMRLGCVVGRRFLLARMDGLPFDQALTEAEGGGDRSTDE